MTHDAQATGCALRFVQGAGAAIIISDAIAGRPNPWAQFFDATRWELMHSASGLVKEQLHTVKHLVGDKIAHAMHTKTAAELAPGDGGILATHGKKAAAYRDGTGALHVFQHTCTHLGCDLKYSAADRCFECPVRSPAVARMSGPATHIRHPCAVPRVVLRCGRQRPARTCREAADKTGGAGLVRHLVAGDNLQLAGGGVARHCLVPLEHVVQRCLKCLMIRIDALIGRHALLIQRHR